MIVDSLRLVNFRSHSDTKVDFTTGINIILGENGAGKTSVLEGISFALFKDYSGSIDDLVRKGEKSMQVELSFTSHGRKYRVVRKRSGSSAEASIFSGSPEREIASGDSGVDREIIDILGIDRYLFTNAVYVRQGDIERLLTETPHRKKQLVGRLLGIEVLEKVWERMKTVMDSYRERQSVIEGELRREDEIGKRKEEISRSVKEVRERIAKTSERIKDAEENLLKAAEEEKKLSSADSSFRELSVKKDELSSMLEREKQRLGSSRKRISEIEDTMNEMEAIGKMLKPGWRKELDSGLARARKRLSEIDGEAGSLRGRISDLREMKAGLEKVGNRCPLCGSELTEEHRKGIVDERERKIKDMEKSLSGLLEEKKRLERDVSEFSDKLESLSEKEKRMVELRGGAGMRDELLGSVKDGEKIISELEIRIKKVMDDIENVKKLKEDYDEARQKSESMRSELGALKEARARQEGKLNELVDSLERVVKEGESLEGKKKEYEKLVSFLKTLDDIRKLFDKSGIQLELRKRAVPAIEKHMLEFFREFNFEYSDISLSEDYEVTLFGPGGETGGRMISGGERIAVALALRLAIAKALAGSSAESVMLDEPTIFLDEQRRQDLVEVFKKLTVIPQMIVVTHDTAMEEAADNINMIIKNRGVSSVKNE